MPPIEAGSHTSENVQREKPSLIVDMARQFAYAAVQKPIAGATQLIDAGVGTNLQEETTFINQPEQSDFGSFRWHAEQLAAGAGAAVPYLAAMAVTKLGLRTLSAEKAAWTLASSPETAKLLGTEGLTAAAIAARYRTAEATAAGFVNGSILEPSEQGKSLLGERLKQGTVAGVTMGTMHALSNRLGDYTGANGYHTNLAVRTVTTATAGAGAGVIGALTNDALNLRVPTFSDTYQSAYAMAFTGGALSLAADSYLRLNQAKTSYNKLAVSVADNPNNGGFFHDSEDAFLSRHFARPLESGIQKVKGLLRKSVELAGTDDDTESASGSTKSNRKLADLSVMTRIEAVAKMEQSGRLRIFTEPKLEGLFKSLDDATADWSGDKVGELEKLSNEAALRWSKAREEHSRLEDDAATRPVIKTRTEDGGVMFHRDYDDVVVARENEARYQTEAIEAQKRLTDLKEFRTATLERVINDFLKENNLPPTVVELSEYPGAWATFGRGKMTLDPRLLNSPKLSAEQVGAMVHELAHLVQNVMVIRALADGLKVKDNNDSNAETIRKFFHPRELLELPEIHPDDAADVRISNDFVDNTIRMLAGKPWTFSEQLEVRSYLNAMTKADPSWVNELEQLNFIIGDRDNVSTDANPKFWLTKLANSPEEVAQQFNFKKVPPDLMKLANDFVNSPDPWKYSDFNPYDHLDPWVETLSVPTESRTPDTTPEALPEVAPVQAAKPEHASAEPSVVHPEPGLPLTDVWTWDEEALTAFMMRGMEAKPKQQYTESEIAQQEAFRSRLKVIMDRETAAMRVRQLMLQTKRHNYYHADPKERAAHPAGLLGYLTAERLLTLGEHAD